MLSKQYWHRCKSNEWNMYTWNPERYVDISDIVHTNKESEENQDRERSKTGRPISLRLFTATSYTIFRMLNVEYNGVKINEDFLNILWFAVGIICSGTPHTLQHMPQELSDESRQMGLKMDIAQTKGTVVDILISLNNVLMQHVEGCVYVGQHYSLKEVDKDKYIQRSIMAGLPHTPNTGISSKATLPSAWRDRCTSHVRCQLWHYGAETAGHLLNTHRTNLRPQIPKWTRNMFNITWTPRRTNISVRERTKVIGIVRNVRKWQGSWAGHTNPIKDDRLTSLYIMWIQLGGVANKLVYCYYYYYYYYFYVSPLGYHMTRNGVKGDQPSNG